jgi:hypothetical protein
MNPSKNWRKIEPIYRYFASDRDNLDFSDKAALDAYNWETNGVGNFKIGLFSNSIANGFVVGKHWMDVTIKMWREDIKSGLLTKLELYIEPDFKEYHWWLDKVL